jgi:mRNA interferase MazF
VSPRYSPGQILLASLVFSSQLGTKNRPVLVIHDAGDDDLLVAPITSHVGRSQSDVFLNGWQAAGLRLPSVVRLEKLATLQRTAVVRILGTIAAGDRQQVKSALQRVTATVLSDW